MPRCRGLSPPIGATEDEARRKVATLGLRIIADRLEAEKGPNAMTFDRITVTPGVQGGRPCIRGMRITVGAIVDEIAAGRSIDQVLADFPYLEREDVFQALQYAAWRVNERTIELT